MFSIGLDIGGTKCAICLAEIAEGGIRILRREEFGTAGKGWRETLEIYSAKIEEWRGSFEIANIGISCGGPLDSKTGVIMSPPNLPGWDDVKITEFFVERFGVPVKLLNDANAGALAEAKWGAGAGARHVVFMTFGTGLGAGIVIDGKLYEGANGNAGEIGHIRLAERGPKGYNKDGSAEGFCSGAGMARLAGIMARELEMEFEGSATAERARGEGLSAKEIFAAVREGDGFCTAVFRESARKLATVLAHTVDILNPEVIVLGGIFMRNADLFMPEIEPILKREALAGALGACRILPAKLSENIGDYAALAAANS